MEPQTDLPVEIQELPEPQMVSSLLLRERQMNVLTRAEDLLKRFSPAERLLLYVFTIVLGVSCVFLLSALNSRISVEIPTLGGSFTEGETGPVRFVNPTLAISQADQDLSQIVYSGLMRVLPDGTYVNDLAENYEVSPDGTTYTFKLRHDASFHDDVPVTAADVLFTVAIAQNPDIRSPHRADWEGVTVSSPDTYTVVFTLPRAYAPFIENTTLGILPKHLWQNISNEEFPFSQLNTHPIGSGPYRVNKVSIDASGSVTRYDLVPFKEFTLDGPYLSRMSFLILASEEALVKAFNAHQIDAIAGVSPAKLSTLKRSDVSVALTPLPRVFGVFFNESHNTALAELAVRQALDESINKQQLVDSVLNGYGFVLDGPLPADVSNIQSPGQSLPVLNAPTTLNASSSSTIAAKLTKAGWAFSSTTQTWSKKKVTLSLKLATADEPELVATANAVAADWKAIGVDVSVQVYPLSDFNNTVLRPRNYDAIVFGEVVGRTSDLFAFWHSSQRNDPGLNLAMYANAKTDALLLKARASTNKQERDLLYAQFADLVQKDIPAIFLYSPDFVYIVPENVHNIQLGALTIPAERFLNVHEWYTHTERVWSFFANTKNIIK